MRSTLLLVAVLGLAACESFHSGSFAQQDAPPAAIDGAVDAPHVPVPRAIAVSGDFGAPGVGTVAKLEVSDMQMTQNVTPGSAQGDPVVRQYGNRVYVINRLGDDDITVLDSKTLGLVEQVSTGTGTNPQDVAVVGSKLYVPVYGGSGVVVIANGAVTQTIDLATALTDPDGKPDCISAYAVGNYVYVACDMATNFANVLDSKIAVIDSTTNTVVGQVVTPAKNPLGFFARAPQTSPYNGDLLIPLVPNFGDLTEGCVARISTTAPTAPTVTCGVTNATLNGYANRVAVDTTHNKLYVAVAESFTVGTLREYDLGTQSLVSPALSSSSELIVDAAVCPGGDIVATDQTTNAGGIRVWRGTTERTSNALSIGMSPTTNGLLCYDP